MADETPEGRAVPLVWVGVEELPVLLANQMIVQHSAPNEFLLTFGQLTPPVILGSDEQRQEQLEGVDYVAVRPVARVGCNRQRMQEFIRVLQENLASHDQTFGEPE